MKASISPVTEKAPRLSEQDIERAVQLLDGWVGKLTWKLYRAVLATHLGHLYSKRGLRNHALILTAWEMANKRLKDSANQVGARSQGDAAIAHAYRRVELLEAENVRLKQENHDLLERFFLWSQNAVAAGLNEERLDRPIR